MVDEYRPAIYHFDAKGVLIDRFVPAFPEADDEEEGEEMVDVGTPTLPEVFAQRRANRGFEAVALKDGLLYAFIQSPIDNPDTSDDASSKASTMARIVEFDTATGETVGQYLYMLDGGAIDKIGDAVALPDGDFLVIERDSAVGAGAQKLIYKMSLENATNIHESEALPVGPNGGLERQRELGLARAGIVPASKSLYVDLGALGYTMGDKPEGLAFVDENTLAVLNDNDFGLLGSFDIETGMLDENPNATPVVLGIIHLRENGFDASDRDDAINIRNWPVFGMYQPDSIAAFETADGVFLATANEGDARDYDGYSEEIRGEDWLLDLAVFPNAAELQQSENLGRMKSTTANGDTDGDGLIDTLYGFGARSLSIWDANGTLVWDSGNEIARVLEAELPDNFNSNGENDTFDNRSDDKGAEPEALTVGTIGDHTYVFLGLERVGGIMVYDVTDVRNPQFVSYFNPRDFSAADEEAGDLAPEGLEFVPAEQSPTGGPILIVANEFSGTTSVYAIETNLE